MNTWHIERISEQIDPTANNFHFCLAHKSGDRSTTHSGYLKDIMPRQSSFDALHTHYFS